MRIASLDGQAAGEYSERGFGSWDSEDDQERQQQSLLLLPFALCEGGRSGDGLSRGNQLALADKFSRNRPSILRREGSMAGLVLVRTACGSGRAQEHYG